MAVSRIKDRVLPANHYHVFVSYAPLPSMKELKKEWGEHNVSNIIFDGRPLHFHASCVGMDRTPGKKTFYVHNPGGDWEREERIAWGMVQRNAAAPNGYRPATHEETYEFAKALPEFMDFLGLGSFAVLPDGCPGVAYVWWDNEQRRLGHWFCRRRNRRTRILFVAI